LRSFAQHPDSFCLLVQEEWWVSSPWFDLNKLNFQWRPLLGTLF
jgi:hypothetical protein